MHRRIAIKTVSDTVSARLQRKVRGYAEGDDVPTLVLFRLALSLFVSQLAWWTAIVIGFLHRHVQTVIDWPDSPWLLIGIVLSTLGALWIGGELLIRQNRRAADDLKEKVTP